METFADKPSVALLLKHFSVITDFREACKVMYPLPEILLLVVCGTICGGDDYDDIVDWGEAHLSFLRKFAELYHGIPCADWLRTLMNRVDPDLFSACFSNGVDEAWPGLSGQIASLPRRRPGTRPRAAPTIAARGSRLCTSSRPSPPTRSSCLDSRRSTSLPLQVQVMDS